jgi:hypothetical protein
MEAIMPLTLNFRDVAQRNIDEFDRLGGFHGQTGCRYRYGLSDLGCAIGICIPQSFHIREEDMVRKIKAMLTGYGIETDDPVTLAFIQGLHDYRAQKIENFSFEGFLDASSVVFSSDFFALYPLSRTIRTWEDLTPDVYKAIMATIVATPRNPE